MNTVVIMFLDLTAKVSEVVEKGVIIHDIFMPVSPLANLAAKMVISNMSTIELSWFGQLVSPITMLSLGFKSGKLKLTRTVLECLKGASK